jgi:tetratricopeptide (TPR) repeat protein
MRRQYVIAVLAAILGTNACVKYQPVRVAGGSGKNPYHSTSPASLSQSIRAVLKTSEENTAGQEAVLDQLLKQRPDLALLARRAKENPADLDSRRALAKAYLEEKLYSHAMELYQEILRKSPADIPAGLGMAQVWDEWGDYTQARQYAEQAAALDRAGAEGHELLGRICLHQHDIDAALRAFHAALRLAPENASILANTGYLHLLRSEWDQAREYLERALEIDASIAEANNHLGIVMAHLGNRDAALSRFLAANPPAASYNNLGTVYLAENRLEEARAEFLHALRLQPDYPKAQANLLSVEALLPPPTLYIIPAFPRGAQANAVQPPNQISMDFAELKPITPATMRDYVRAVFSLPPVKAAAEASAALRIGLPPVGKDVAPIEIGNVSVNLRPDRSDIYLVPAFSNFQQIRIQSPEFDVEPAALTTEAVASKPNFPKAEAIAAREVKLDKPAVASNPAPAPASVPPKLQPRATETSTAAVSNRRAPRTYAIQTDACRTESGARSAVARLEAAALTPEISRADLNERGVWYRVRLLGYESLKAAVDAAKRLLSQGIIRSFWVVPDGSVD